MERAPSIPRYGISSPFKGHLSTKSNAFCLGSSSRLCDQYSIRDHMITHHKKIHSAKAAVDCSVPKSLLKSIKYSDQQRREKVKREVERFEKESLHSRSGSRPSSTSSRSSRSLLRDKDFYERNGQITRASPYSYHEELDSPSTYLPSPRNSGFLEDHVQLCRVANKRHPQVSRTTHRKHYELSSSPSEASASRSFSRFQDNYVKTYSGDLLDKHSEQFTNTHRPFTPRTLKTDAKSVLAQYRYYTPPRRKKKEDNEEAESQADVCSLLERSTKSQKKESLFLRDQDVQAKKEMFDDSEDERNSYSHFSENQIDWAKLSNHQRFFSRLSYNELKSPSPIMQKIQSEEEELVHLKFVTDITNEILSLGLFSNRVLERVFERHVAENKKNLDEGKMRHLLDTLRKDLGCKVTSMSNNNNKTSETEDKHLYLHTDGVGNEASQPQNVSYLEEWKAENLLQDDILQDVSDNSVDIDRLLAEDLEDDEREALKDKTSTPLSMPECDEDTEVIDKLDGLDGLEECFSEHLQLSKEEDCSAIGDVAESIASVTSRVIEEENDLD